MKGILILILVSQLSSGCKTNNFGKSRQLFSNFTTVNLFKNDKNQTKKSSNYYNLNISAYEAKMKIDILCQKRENIRKNIAINNIHDRSTALSIIKTLELMTKSERANFLRIYDSGNLKNTIKSLLSQEIKHEYLRKRAEDLINEASTIHIKNERIIVSDLDNTILPSNDPSVNGYAYPGTIKLLQALDQKIKGDIHIVTARPFGARNALNSAEVEYNSISYGNICGIATWLLGFQNSIKERKIKNIRKLMDRNTKSNVILIGDDGQVDAEVYLQIIKDYPDRVEAALIHNVLEKKLPDAFSKNPRSIIYNDFSDAADSLHSRGIITKRQSEEITNTVGRN